MSEISSEVLQFEINAGSVGITGRFTASEEDKINFKNDRAVI